MTTTEHLVPGAGLAAVQELCRWPISYAPPGDLDALFATAMREITLWHQTHSTFYRRFLSDQKFDPRQIENVSDLAKLPFLPAPLFKQHEILSVGREQISVHLTSSGTSGQKSQIFFDDWSLGIAQDMVARIFDHYGWISSEATNYLLYTYETKPDSKLGTAFTDHFLCRFAPIHQLFVALKNDGHDQHDFDIYGTIEALQRFESDGKPLRIFGFPAFLAATLRRMKDRGLKPLKLSPRSLVFLGGGWKGQQVTLSKPELYNLAHEMLGIPRDRLRDGFGSVEHCVPYIECAAHRFHVPSWSRVFIRDFRDFKVLPFGESGFLNFVSPYITSVPAHSVLMQDEARLHPAASCECALPTPWFEIVGRAGTSKNRSCALAAAELLERPRR